MSTWKFTQIEELVKWSTQKLTCLGELQSSALTGCESLVCSMWIKVFHKISEKYCWPINLPFSLCVFICCSVWILEHSSVVNHWILCLTIVKGNKWIKVCLCEEFLILHSLCNFFQSQVLRKWIWKWSWSVKCFIIATERELQIDLLNYLIDSGDANRSLRKVTS